MPSFTYTIDFIISDMPSRKYSLIISTSLIISLFLNLSKYPVLKVIANL